MGGSGTRAAGAIATMLIMFMSAGGRVCDTLSDGEVSQFCVICNQKLQDLDEREVRVHVG